ncbi:MAG TPA: tripartite tricarboxylate transporter substrate binding protein [Burkholderiales bacterium]|nr:tripartite tricarboxylate transporter substrate binding protein [Burkholderiales bacterium]
MRIVVPSSPGGASDLVTRIVSTALGERLGQSFVVENRVTSGGIVGTQQVAEAAPDGYTLLGTFDTFAINPYLFKGLKWDPVRDFAPLMQVCRYPQVLLVHPSLGVKTVKEFVALAKEKGAQLNYGSAGPASSSRLAYELFRDTAGIETVGIHYKGGGPAIQDLLSGQVQVMLIQGGGSIPQYVKTGKLVALAVSSLERSKFYPELPTIAETYPGFESESWVGLFAPAATPRAVLERLHDELARTVSDPVLRERLEAQGCDVVGGPSETMSARVRSDQAKWSRIIRDKNINVQ